MLTIIFNVMCFLAGIVCPDTMDLHLHQRVYDGFLLFLVDFR